MTDGLTMVFPASLVFGALPCRSAILNRLFALSPGSYHPSLNRRTYLATWIIVLTNDANHIGFLIEASRLNDRGANLQVKISLDEGNYHGWAAGRSDGPIIYHRGLDEKSCALPNL